MKLMKYSVLLIICLLLTGNILAQSGKQSFFKKYPGSVEGRIRYYSFHYLDIKNVDGSKMKRQVGEFSRQGFKLDTLREDNYLAIDRFIEQLNDLNAKLYLKDENSVYFSFTKNNEYYWGRFYSKEYKSYVVTLVKEKRPERKLFFYSDDPFVYNEYVTKVQRPPVIRPMKGSIITKAKFSKYNSMEFTYSDSDKRYKKSVGGKYWEYKMKFTDKEGNTDKTVSKFEINENYFYEVINKKGKILKEIGNMIIFNIPAEGYTVWCRMHASMDGIYSVRIIQEMSADYTPPVEQKIE